MIRLQPLTESKHECVYCRTALECVGWYVPGMRNLADLRCAGCGREFYGDLFAGQAFYTPMLLEKGTGAVHDAHGVKWFADWLRDSYAQRTDSPLPFVVQEYSPVKQPVVMLNCLDTLYGHSLLKLLNAQHYLDKRADFDLILLVPSFLKWMIPDGVAQAWIVDLPLRRGTEWNDWLAREIRRRVAPLSNVSLSVALSHPHPNDYDIERFTRVRPFPLDEWKIRLERPTVTFIWREDRLWRSPAQATANPLDKIVRRVNNQPNSLQQQSRQVTEFAEALRKDWPALDFAVAGVGRSEAFPNWINDLRQTVLDDAVERQWCERYAASHLVVGVHGSNMLLPSAHAGGFVELIGAERWGNFLQDVLFRRGDSRELFFRCRFMPDSTTSSTLALLLGSILRSYPDFMNLMGAESCRHSIEHRSFIKKRAESGAASGSGC